MARPPKRGKSRPWPIRKSGTGWRRCSPFTRPAQLLVYRAAWMLEQGIAEAHTVVDSAKVFITEAAEEVARGAMQIAALDGYLGSNALEAGYRDARFGPVAGESSEVLRMRIADDCLGKVPDNIENNGYYQNASWPRRRSSQTRPWSRRKHP